MAATATAFLGYVSGAQTGSVTLPLAIPHTALQAAAGSSTWWARLLGTPEAVASGPRQLTFRDLGSESFYANNLNKPLFDLEKAYLFVVVPSDPVPDTIIENIKYTYKTSGVKPIRPMQEGTRLYPLSEYKWASNIKSIFATLKQAYNANKDSNNRWRVLLPVYAPVGSEAWLRHGLRYLARAFGPGMAQACFTFWTQTYPGGNVPIEVRGFANVDVMEVTYNPSCKTCSNYYPYSNSTECMIYNPDSCRNTNSITIEIPVDVDTVSPGGTISGGPDNQRIVAGGAANTGAIAAIPRLVK